VERRDPDVAADERTTLAGYLDFQRATLVGKATGLSGDQLRRRHEPSTLTLAGLVKHLALVEDSWLTERFKGRPAPEPWADAPWDEDPDWEFHSAVDDEPAALLAVYEAACDRSRQVLDATSDLGALSEWRDRSGRRWSLRAIVVHLIEETARHNGHADLLREALDGTVGE